jgi:signal transduction histidine kinase
MDKERWTMSKLFNSPAHERDPFVSTIMNQNDPVPEEPPPQTGDEVKFTVPVLSNSIIYLLDTSFHVTDLAGNWLINNALSPDFFLGKTPEELLGRKAALIHDQANVIALGGKCLAYRWSYQWRQKTWLFQTALSPFINSRGQIDGLVGIVKNLDDLMTSDEDREDFPGVDATLNFVRFPFLHEVAHILAHQIRNPITTVSLLMQMLQEDSNLTKYQEFIRMALEDIYTINSVIANLLSMTEKD